jgi:hypothetical protein
VAESGDTVVIRDASGKKICEIHCYQKYVDRFKTAEFGRSDFGGFLTMSYKRKVWKNPDAIALWAWRQAIYSSDDLQQGKTSTLCILCGKMSMAIKKTILRKNRWRGIACTNSNCPMFNVLIPAKMFYTNPPKYILDGLGVNIKKES